MRRMKRLFLFALLGCSSSGLTPLARAADKPPPNATPREIEDGQKASAELEKSKGIKLLDPASSPAAKVVIDKLNAMAKRLGAASARPGINYTVKVIDSKDVNAFTLPNGHIYVYKGLLDNTSSDDEIAGVLAHEIGHNARMHAIRGEKQAKKLSLASLVAMAAMLAGGSSGADVGQFSQYLLLGVMNGYGVGYEKEADAAGIEEMIAAGYNPSAMVTFMRRLQLIESRSPEVHLGIFQTHPPSDERADAMLSQLQHDGVTFTPRAVSGGKVVTVTEKPDQYLLQLGDVTLLTLDKTGANAQARASSAAAKINELLRADLQMWEITAMPDGRLLGRGQLLAAATLADAKAAKATPAAVAQSWVDNFKRIFWAERLNGRF